jgi:26S proteasome regulatory subunit N4
VHLQNDYKSLMTRIEVGLHAHFAKDQTQPGSSAETVPESAPHNTGFSNSTSNYPFAKIDSIAPNSPAAIAGLRVNDKIRKFATINWANHDKLSKVAQVVTQREGVR